MENIPPTSKSNPVEYLGLVAHYRIVNQMLHYGENEWLLLMRRVLKSKIRVQVGIFKASSLKPPPYRSAHSVMAGLRIAGEAESLESGAPVVTQGQL